MDDETPSKSPAESARFAVLTLPVRRLTERAVGRVRPNRPRKPPAVPVVPDQGFASSVEATPAPSFATSEVISAFHLQQLRLPSRFERLTRGAVTSGKVAIVVSAFALVSLIGLGLWVSSPGADSIAPAGTVGNVAVTNPAQVGAHETTSSEVPPDVRLGSAAPAHDLGLSVAERAATENAANVTEPRRVHAPAARTSKLAAKPTPSGAAATATSSETPNLRRESKLEGTAAPLAEASVVAFPAIATPPATLSSSAAPLPSGSTSSGRTVSTSGALSTSAALPHVPRVRREQ